MSPRIPAAARRPGRGAALSARLAFQLFALAVLLTAACAWVAVALVESAFERRLSAELDRLRSRVAPALDETSRELAVSLERLEAHLVGREPKLLERLLDGGPGAADVAGRLLFPAAVDFLEVRDPAGTVVSSAPRPERIGLPADGPGQSGAGGGGAELADLEGLDGGAPGLLLTRTIKVGSRELVVAAGKRLGRAYLARVAGGDAAVLVGRAGGPPIASVCGERLDPNRLAEALPEQADGHGAAAVRGPDGSRWLARRVPLAPGRAGGPFVAVAVERTGLEPVLARMRRGFIAVGCVAGLLAALAGAWMGQRISRPVRELVRAFDAVSAGEADYAFPSARQDDLQELIASVSRLKRALEMQQQRSIAAERVATWRDVARHVAHEVKNPLAPIRLTVQNLLRARREAPERFEPMFEEGMRTILDEVEQLRRMVGEFSEFARLPLPAPQPQDLERLVESVLDLYAVDPRVTVARRYASGLPPVELDADQISRALKNVVGNAVEACRERPLLLEIGIFLEDDMVRVEVADNGPGFSEEAAARVFEPYFTTRSGGTGLGMALTYRIVVEHGGVITAGNRPQGGATVSFRLPLRAPGRGAEAAPLGRWDRE